MSETLESVQVAKLKPGDIVVLELNWRPTDAARARMHAGWKKALGCAGITYDVPLLVVPNGRLRIARMVEE